MANTEQTFADRLQRGSTMQSKTAGFAPAFDPADATLDPVTFDTFLQSVVAANLAVATTGAAETSKAKVRRDFMLQIKDRTTRLVNYVGSNEAWDQYFTAVKQAADKVRNFRPSKKAVTPPNGDTLPAKKRMTGQQSYGDIDGLFEKVLEAVKLVPAYAPPVTSQIQLVTLGTLQTSYRQANKDVATTEAAASKAVRTRKALYDAKTNSLRSKMKAIKKATRAQYGASSAEFADVKSIKL
jgi:hypothetical protein